MFVIVRKCVRDNKLLRFVQHQNKKTKDLFGYILRRSAATAAASAAAWVVSVKYYNMTVTTSS